MICMEIELKLIECSDDWLGQIASDFKTFQLPAGTLEAKWNSLNDFGKKQLSLETLRHMCVIEPCMNGGECVKDATKPLGFSCRCLAQYIGPMCDHSSYVTITYFCILTLEM